MDKDWLFVTDEYICDLRTVAVFIKNDKILVQRDRDGSEYALHGGHIKIGETLENGLIREIMEEMGVQIECRRLLWSEECFRKWNGKQVHNIAFYYLIKLCDDFEIPDNGEFAIAIRSLKHNFDGRYTDGKKIFDFKPQMFLDVLGVDFDYRKYKYYIMLDELF